MQRGKVHAVESQADGSLRHSSSKLPSDPLGGSFGNVGSRKSSAIHLQRSASITSTSLMPSAFGDRRNKNRNTGSVLSSAAVSTISSKFMSARVSPSKTSSLDNPRDSSASRAKALSEFSIFLKIMDEVAIHFVTLYFINVNSSAVIAKMEESFTKYYAKSQQKLYLRGLTALIVFMVSTCAYDYLVLYADYNLSSNSTTTTTTSKYVGNTKMSKFALVVSLKFAVVLPVLVLTYYRAKMHSYLDDFYLTWVCSFIVSSYPLVYNKLTNDYGVSWVCLVIMYLYSCTPVRFFPCTVFCFFYLVLYVVVMLSSATQDDLESVSNETLYACMFYLLILLPSQSREFAIRVSYMSELMVLLQQEQLKMEEMRSKSLLNSMLPESIVVQLQCGRELIADAYPHATVLFAEVCDFDFYSSKLQPEQVVELLNILFYKFDKLVDVHHVHKVETIGAVYMVVGGCPDQIENHAELVANLALDMIKCIPEVSDKVKRKPWGNMVKDLNIRIGINSGSLMAGVVGIRNPRFKLFGDTVNVASRMETTNLPGQIQITEATNNILSSKYFTAFRGKVFVKGRGDMSTYYLRGKGNYIVPPPAAAVTSAVIESNPSSIPIGSVPTGRRGSLIGQPIPEDNETGRTATTTDATPIPQQPPSSPETPAARVTNARYPRRKTSMLDNMDSTKLSPNKRNSLHSIIPLALAANKFASNAAAPSGGSASGAEKMIASHLSAARSQNSETSTIISAAVPLQHAGSGSGVPIMLSQQQRRGTITQLRPAATMRNLASGTTMQKTIFRENIFDIVEDADENTSDTIGMDQSTAIMKLPKGLTRREVLLRIHGYERSATLTQEAFEFEESYRLENHSRWIRFVRLSITVLLLLKPFMTMYQILRLSATRLFAESHFIFVINFCVMYPVCIVYVLATFSPKFRDWEQLSSVATILIVALTLNAESVAANSAGHAYMSVIALYQCYFAGISFLLRVANGCTILVMYVMTNMYIAPHFDLMESPGEIRVARNALYIFIFFAGQAWVVFNSEFKQRINHYRDITLNSQKQKLVEEEAVITKLLLNLLPETIVHKLKEDPEATIADFFDNVTVLFTDMVNFTAYSSKVSAMELVQFLNDMYTRFDTISEKENLYKVEIIGDAYFVVGGCPIVSTTNALAVVTAATDMFAALPTLRRNCGLPDLNIRIGVHSGPVLAGVVGSKDPRYHLFGETVTVAHILESSGSPGRIHISESTWAHMNKDTPGHGFKVEYHTLLSINGYAKKIRTYFVL